ncbi:MAG: Ig-like domain-containing protein, partial [Pseudomonadota bacterium]
MLSAFGKIFRTKPRAVEAPDGDKPLMRALEPRVLLDAAAVETASDAAQATHTALADAGQSSSGTDTSSETESDTPPAAFGAEQQTTDIVFIDGAVDDIGGLLTEIDSGVEVHILDLQSDGVEQIATILNGRQDIDAVHIFSHGGAGFLNLGSGQLSSETITQSHVTALQQIGSSLSEGGDILFYGCNFGEGEQGRQVAEQLAEITGADIAASNDLTGSEDLGGDWDLEIVQGSVEATSFSAPNWNNLLAEFTIRATQDPVVTGGTGVGASGLWENAGTVGGVSIDIRATVTATTGGAVVGFDTVSTTNPGLDDMRITVGQQGSATVIWEIFLAGTNTRPTEGEVSLTIADIDGTAGNPNSIEAVSANLSGLSSYTVQAPTNQTVVNDGTLITSSGTQDQDTIDQESWVQFSWGSVNQLELVYTTYDNSTRFFDHDGDGDLVFTNPNTSFATGIDLDQNDSSGATGSSYQDIFFTNAGGGGTPVAIADGDIDIDNPGGGASSATIILTNASAGDQLNVNTAVMASLGITPTIDTSVSGQITVSLAGAASTDDYQTAIQSITYENTVVGFDPTIRLITVQVFDGAFASGIAETNISFGNIVNQPTPVQDVYVGDEDTTLSVGVASGLLSNDTDPNSDPLTVVSALDSGSVVIPVNAVGAASPVAHLLPSGSTLVLYADGSFDYTPPADYSGVEFFNYTIEDPAGNSADSYASINIRGVADTPIIPGGIVSAVGDEDVSAGPVDLTATQGDTDNSETLRYSLTGVPSGYTLTDGTRSFTSTGTADVLFLDEWDVTQVTLQTPASNNHSDADITLSMTVESREPNGSVASATGSVLFNFAAVADAPLLTGSTAGTGVDVPLAVGPFVNASLVDQDGSETLTSLTFSNIPAGYSVLNNGVPLTITAGSVTFAAADLADITVVSTPGFLGVYQFDITATSTESNPQDDVSVAMATSAPVTLVVTVDAVDDPVTAIEDSGETTLNTPLTLDLLGNDLVPDGGGFVSQIDGTTPVIGTPFNLASGNGQAVLNADGTVTFTFTGTATGTETVTYQITDVDGSVDTGTVFISVQPEWSVTGVATTAEGTDASFDIVLTGGVPAGQTVSVDLALADIDTTSGDYGDLAAAVTSSVSGRSDLSFDGTTLTYSNDAYVANYDATGSTYVDISATGNVLTLGDEVNQQQSIGFDFEFFGETYSDLFVHDNGFVTFGSGIGNAFNNANMSGGTQLGGRPAIAALWNDLDTGAGGTVYTQTVGAPGAQQMIIQWDDVPLYSNGGNNGSFQIIISEATGEVRINYQDVDFQGTGADNGGGSTIAIQDGSGTGIQHAHNTAGSVVAGSSVVFSGSATMAPLTIDLSTASDSNFESDEDFQLVLSNASSSTIDAAQNAATTTILDTNDAPVNTVPVTGGTAISQTTTPEDTPLVFNAANGNTISVDDPDGDTVTVTLTATNGTLLANAAGAATISGQGTASVTLSGTQAQVNSALDGLSFTNTADYNGTASLTVVTNDNTGTATAETTSVIDIAITPVADALDDVALIDSGAAAIINVLANDFFEGPITSVTAVDGASGTVTVNPDNTITYTSTGAPGTFSDSFTYTVTAGGVTETATVLVVKPPLPEPDPDTGATNEDAVLNVAASGLLGNDTTITATPVLDFDTITMTGPDAGSWDDGSNTFPFTWASGITENTSPTTAYPGITSSLTFDGSQDALATDLGSLAGSPSDADASFEIWFQYDPADYTAGNGAVLYETGGSGDGMSIALSDAAGTGSGTIDHIRVQFNNSNAAGGETITLLADLNEIVGPGNIAGEFIQVTAVYDRDSVGTDDTVTLFVNGIEVGTQTVGILNDWDGGSDASLGGNSNGPNVSGAEFDTFIGDIAQFRFYETTLDAGQVKDTFDAVAGLTVTAHDATSSLGATVTVNADGSYSYDPTTAPTLQALAAGASVTDTFSYTVTDANGLTASETVTITVLGVNDAPEGVDSAVTTLEDTPYTFSSSDFGFTDPVDSPGDSLFEVSIGTLPANGTLIFDNGTGPAPLTAGVVIAAADIDSGALQFVPAADENNASTPGAAYSSFTFTVGDDGGTANGGQNFDATPNTMTLNVTPVQDAPVLSVPGAQNTVEDVALSITGMSVADLDGDTLLVTLTVPGGSGALSVASGSGAVVTGSASTTVTINGTAAQVNAALVGLTFTPSADYNTDTGGAITLGVSLDDGTDTVSNTVAITVTSQADITDDSITTNEDTAVTFNALTGVGGGTADSFENSGAIIRNVTQGATGTVGFTTSGELTYTPTANFNGVDTFTYTVTSPDGVGGETLETATVTVSVSPVNDAPTPNNDTAAGTEDGPAVTGNVLTNDTDIDAGDTLTVEDFTYDVGPFLPPIFLAGSPATIPGVGTITIQPNGAFTFAPIPNFNGTVPTITYTMSDGTEVASADLDITIAALNDAPVATNDGPVTVVPGVATSISVLTNDSDVDGDTLTVTNLFEPGAMGSPISITLGDTVTLASGTQVSLLAGGILSVVQPLGADGSEDFSYEISDGQGETDVAQVTLLTDTDADGVANITDIDDDNDGILDIVEQGIIGATDSGINGSIPASNVSFEITSADLSDPDGDHVLDAITINGVRYPNYIFPDSYAFSFAAAGQDATFRENGTNAATLSGSTTWEADILPAFQSPDLNDYQVLGQAGPNWTAGDYYELGYSEPFLVSDGAFIGVTERGGNNALQLQAFDENGVALGAPIAVNSSDFISTGASQNASQTAEIALFALDDLAPPGSFVSSVRVILPGGGDAPDGKVFLIGEPAALQPTGNQLDLDSDDDGITDNLEAQTTAGYIAPSGVDADGDGLDDAYDADDTSADAVLSAGLAPVDTDGDGVADYTDHDSDNDGTADIAERGDGAPTSITSMADSDGDGLLDIFEGSNANDGFDANDENLDPTDTNFDLAGVPALNADGSNAVPITTDLLFRDINDAPAATADTATGIEDAASVTGNVLTNDTDADGDPLIVTTFNISTLTGPFAAGSTVTIPAIGDLTISATGAFTFVPLPNYNGSVPTVSYGASDPSGAVAASTLDITITPANDAPVAVDDVLSGNEDGPAVTGNVLTNDSDPDGDALSVLGFTVAGVSGTFSAGTLATIPAVGDIDILANGAVTFVPDADWNGSVPQITYTMSDGTLTTTAFLDITITPVNDAPIALNDSVTTVEDTPVTILVGSNDSDVDGDTLTITQVDGQSVTDGGAAVPVDNGTVALVGGDLVFTPDANFNSSTGGTVTFSYTVDDAQGSPNSTATADVTVTVTALNDTPVAGADSFTTPEDTAVSIVIATNDSDPDGDTLTVLEVDDQPLTDGGAAVPVTNGTVQLVSGELLFTPDPNYNGPISFTYTVDDGQSALNSTATATVTGTVLPVNDNPVASDDTFTVSEDAPLTILGNVITGDTGFGADVDIDGDNLAVSAATVDVDGDGDQDVLAPGVATLLSNATGSVGVVVLENNGTILFAPAPNYNSTDGGAVPVITYTLIDESGASSTATITLDVTAVNDAPVASADSFTINEDTVLLFDPRLNDNDADGDALTITAIDGQAIVAGGSSVAVSNGSVSLTAAGLLEFTPDPNVNVTTVGILTFDYTVDDGQGAANSTATATVSVRVLPLNDAPLAGDDTFTTAEDTAVSVPVLVNDTDIDGDTLTVTEVDGLPIVDGGAAVAVANGTVQLVAGDLVFTPDGNFNSSLPGPAGGPVSFEYRVEDGFGGV